MIGGSERTFFIDSIAKFKTNKQAENTLTESREQERKIIVNLDDLVN